MAKIKISEVRSAHYHLHRYHSKFFVAKDYAEPGYRKTPGHLYILFGNWNSMPADVMARVEKAYDTEWSDEWATCPNCDNAYRTTGNSYNWTRYAATIQGDEICGDCVKNNVPAYLETLRNEPNKADVFGIDLTVHGYAKLDREYKNDWYGNADQPADILQSLQKALPCVDVVFQIDHVHQWGVNFVTWLRVKDGF